MAGGPLMAVARARVASLPNLPSFDARLVRILTGRDSERQFEELGAHIRSDAPLAGRIVSVANSAFFSRARAIRSIEQAFSVLGSRTVSAIALAASLDTAFEGCGEPDATYLQQLRRYSLRVGVAARRIVGERDVAADTWSPQSAFLMGLLHDLGHLVSLRLRYPLQGVLAAAFGASAGGVAENDPGPYRLGAALFEHWGLPEEFLAAVVGYRPEWMDRDADALAGLLPLANQLALLGSSTPQLKPRLPAECLPLRAFGLDTVDVLRLVEDIETEGALLDALMVIRNG